MRLIGIVVAVVVLVLFICFMERAQRRILIQYPKRQTARGVQAECVKLNGAMEIAPTLGLWEPTGDTHRLLGVAVYVVPAEAALGWAAATAFAHPGEEQTLAPAPGGRHRGDGRRRARPRGVVARCGPSHHVTAPAPGGTPGLGWTQEP